MVAVGIVGTGRIAEQAVLTPAAGIDEIHVVAAGSRNHKQSSSPAVRKGLPEGDVPKCT